MNPLIIGLIFLAFIYSWATGCFFWHCSYRRKDNVFVFDSTNLGYLRIQYIEFFFCLSVSYYPRINITVRKKLVSSYLFAFVPWGWKRCNNQISVYQDRQLSFSWFCQSFCICDYFIKSILNDVTCLSISGTALWSRTQM